MPGIVEVSKLGPLTFPVGEPVTGGQLVVFGTGGNASRVVIAGLNAPGVLGVAVTDAAPEVDRSTNPSQNIDLHVPRGDVAVAHIGVYRLVATGAIVQGDKVKAGANGTVVTAGATPSATDLPLVIGQCIERTGIANGARGKIKLMLS